MIKFSDAGDILLDDVKTLKDGYKVVRSKIARTGIQYYYAKDFGDEAIAHGYDPFDKIAVYRPAEEVFAPSAVNGWAGVPVTLDHPDELVDPYNVKEYQVGDVRDKAHVDAKNGWFGLEWIIRDSDAIKKFDSGEYREVSGGYTADIVWGDGVSPDGKRYQATQTKITPNHLAMVVRGRAFVGDSADSWGIRPVTVEDREMTVEMTKVILSDGASVEVKASDAATVAAIVKDHKEAVVALETKIDLRDAEIAELKSKVLTDAEIEALVKNKIELNAKREAVKAKIGDKADAYDDARIELAFELLDHVQAPADDAARKAISDAKPVLDAEAKIQAAIAARFDKGMK